MKDKKIGEFYERIDETQVRSLKKRLIISQVENDSELLIKNVQHHYLSQLKIKRNHVKELKEFYLSNQHKFIPKEVRSELKLRNLFHEFEETATNELVAVSEIIQQGANTYTMELSRFSHQENQRDRSFMSLESSQILLSRQGIQSKSP